MLLRACHIVQGLVAHGRRLPLLVVQPQDLRVELPDDKHQLWDPRRAEEVPAGDLRVWKVTTINADPLKQLSFSIALSPQEHLF